MDGENQNPNVPNDSPVTPAPAAGEQPAAPTPQPTPAPAPMQEPAPAQGGKKGMGKSLMWGIVVIAVLVVVFLVLR